MKILIVDDERLAREELRRLLSGYGELEIVGEAVNGHEALEAVQKLRPDAVFLDIQMPGLNGLEVAASLQPPIPSIVFLTAYDRHAIQAFEFSAVDYLLKPAEPARLAATVQRLLDRHAEAEPENTDVRRRLAETDKVFLRDGEHCWFVSMQEIKLLESEGNYTRIHFSGGAALLYRSLSDLEARLPERLFFRVNRSQVINVHAIERVEPWFSGSLKAFLNGGVEVEFSRRAATVFRDRMSL